MSSKMMEIHATDATVQEGYRRLKLVFSIIAKSDVDSSGSSNEYNVGSYALVRFNFEYTDCITTSVSLKLQTLQEHSNGQIKVTCNVDGEVKQFVCPQLWSEFLDMHETDHIFERDNSRVFAIPIEITVDTSIPSPWSLQSLHSDGSFTDFNLISKTGTVPVHRAVMANHSDVFKTMLNGEWKETADHCLEVEGVTQQSLQHLKNYMYLGSLPEDEDLRPLLLIAKCYMMQHLEKVCSDRLAQSVTTEKYQDTLEFAVDNRLMTLISCMVKNVPPKVVEDSEALTNQQLKLY